MNCGRRALRPATHCYGLSMGYCLCLNMADHLGYAAVTADTNWGAVAADPEIRNRCFQKADVKVLLIG